MIVAAAPAPPVPAPPGKPPFPILSSSLRRGSSSWWFSNGNAHGRDSTTSSRATRRRWWSDPDGSQEDYGSSSVEDDYDYDYEDEAAFPGFGGAGEPFDEPWFSKVFKTYGFLLPVMLVSMFAATGTKAFLMAMVFPLGQSAISFLLEAVWGRRKGNRDDRRWRRPVQEEEEEDYPEDATDFATGGRGNGYSGSSSNYYEGRRGWRSYQSRVSNDFADAASTAVGADDNTKSSSSGDDWGGNKSGGGYGGWDELLDNNTAAAQEAKRSSNSFSAGSTDYNTKSRPSATGEEDADYTAAAGGGGRVEQGVGAPPERMRMRRRRMPRTMGLGTTRYKQAPLLMRLLVAVFPFMGSWFRL
ncbi:uncharacterized protein [Miscanthus floridulus]|uniref:uncharacterized protein isoform X1 n=1 Tax=Miscanthus floridulus TaxID=154761 RepID=UPI003459D49A